jgi:hypothetical protein
MKKNIFGRGMRFLKESYYRLNANLKNHHPIFIVGCGHSGTTLLLRILANHDKVFGIPYESKAFQGNYPKISKVIEWNKELIANQKERWVEKTPKHIQYIDRIFSIFPKAKVIVMLRDGRDVTVSIRKRFGDSKLAAQRWIEDNKAGLKFEDDSRVTFLKLEDLTEDPQSAIRKICRHINLEYNDELLNYQNSEFQFNNQRPEKTTKLKGEDHSKNRVWQVNQPIFKSTSKWKNEATLEENKIFQENKDFIRLMEYLGYK